MKISRKKFEIKDEIIMQAKLDIKKPKIINEINMKIRQ